MAEDATRAEVNRLYWESDRSVGDIADDLGVSRRSLYERIDPLPAGRPCPDCGAPLGYRNRTAAENLEAECAACGREAVLDRAANGAPAPEDHAGPELEQELAAAPLAPVPPRAVPGRPRAPLLSGSLLAGLAAGAAAAWLIRRR